VKEPEIGSLGICSSCIVISLEKDFLETEKARQLAELERRWEERNLSHGGSTEGEEARI
jgi:hypothetical protein